MHRELQQKSPPFDETTLREAKELGFSDRKIGELTQAPRGQHPRRAQAAGHRAAPRADRHPGGRVPGGDELPLLQLPRAGRPTAAPSWRKKIMVLGSGAYRIGSSVEFDWCCVNAVKAARELGYETIMVNYNPETVSTDYDVCDKLIFDEVSFEIGARALRARAALRRRGRQHGRAGAQQPGHPPAPRRACASSAPAPRASIWPRTGASSAPCSTSWASTSRAGSTSPTSSEAERIVERLGGYPVLVRPSYVLSGAAMSVAHEPNELARILARAKAVSPEHPVVISKFETHAREIEIDAVADDGEIVLWAISEHVEDAGVHSGDATLVLPPQIALHRDHPPGAQDRRRRWPRRCAITGPFNVQFLAKHNAVKVIECNLRASRSFPFVSKVTGNNFVVEAMRRMLGVAPAGGEPRARPRLRGGQGAACSPSRGWSAPTRCWASRWPAPGEVGCFGDDLHEALLHALLATGFRVPKKGVLLSLGPLDRQVLVRRRSAGARRRSWGSRSTPRPAPPRRSRQWASSAPSSPSAPSDGAMTRHGRHRRRGWSTW